MRTVVYHITQLEISITIHSSVLFAYAFTDSNAFNELSNAFPI